MFNKLYQDSISGDGIVTERGERKRRFLYEGKTLNWLVNRDLSLKALANGLNNHFIGFKEGGFLPLIFININHQQQYVSYLSYNHVIRGQQLQLGGYE